MALVVYTGILTSHRDWTTAVKCPPLVPELSNVLPKVVGYPFTLKSECASASGGKDKAGCVQEVHPNPQPTSSGQYNKERAVCEDDADLASEECTFEFVVPKAPLPDVGLISASRDTTILTWKRPEVVAAARAQQHRHLNQAKKQSAIERHVKRNKKIASPLSLLSFASTDEENAAAAALSKSAPVYKSKEGQHFLTVVPVRPESSRENKQRREDNSHERRGSEGEVKVIGAASVGSSQSNENSMPRHEQMASVSTIVSNREKDREEREYTADDNDNNNRITNNRLSPPSSVGCGNVTGASAATTANYNNNCNYDANGGKEEEEVEVTFVGSSSLTSAENTIVRIITSPSGEGLGFVSERLTSAPSKRSIKTAAAVHGIDLSSSSTCGGKIATATKVTTVAAGGPSGVGATAAASTPASAVPLPLTAPPSSSSLPPSSIHAKPFVPMASSINQKRATDVAAATVLPSPSKRISTQEWKVTEQNVGLSGIATAAASQRRSSNAPSASASSTTCAIGVDTTRATSKRIAGKHVSSSSTAPTKSNASSSTATTSAQQQLPFLQAGNRYEVHSGFVSDLALSNKVYASSKRTHVLWSDDEEGYKLPPPTLRGAVNTDGSGLKDTRTVKASVDDNNESGAPSMAGKGVEGSRLSAGSGIVGDVHGDGGAGKDHRSPPPPSTSASRSTEHEAGTVAADSTAASAAATVGAMNPNGKGSAPSSPSSQSFTVSSSSSNDRGTSNTALTTQEQMLASGAAPAAGHLPFYSAYAHHPANAAGAAFFVAAPPLPPPPYSHLPPAAPIPPTAAPKAQRSPLRASRSNKVDDNSANKTSLSLPSSSSSPTSPATSLTPFPQGKDMYYLAASASWDKSIRIVSIPYSELSSASNASVASTSRTTAPHRLHGGGDEDGVVGDSDHDEEEAADSAQQLLRVPVTLSRHCGSAHVTKSGAASGETQIKTDGDDTDTPFVPSSFPLPLSRLSSTPLVEYRPIPKIAAAEKKLLGHTGDVLSVSFSPDDRLLASGGRDAVLKLWSVETGECLWSSPSTKGAGGVGGSGVSGVGAPTYASVLSRNVQSAPPSAAESSSDAGDHSQLFVDCWASPTQKPTDQSSHTQKKLGAAENTHHTRIRPPHEQCSPQQQQQQHAHAHSHRDWISVVCFSPKAVDTVVTTAAISTASTSSFSPSSRLSGTEAANNGGRSSGRKGEEGLSKRTTATTTTTVTQLFSLVSASWDGTVRVWSVRYTRTCSSCLRIAQTCMRGEKGSHPEEEDAAEKDVRETVAVTCRYVYRGFSSSSSSSSTASLLAAKQRGGKDLGEKASTIPVTALTISPDGSLCAAGSKLGSVHMLDLATIVERTFPPRHRCPPSSSSSSGASASSAAGVGEGFVIPAHHQSLPSDAEVLCFTLGVTGSETLSSSSSSPAAAMITQLAFSPKYFWLTVATEAGHLSIYDLERAVSLADLIPEMLLSSSTSGGGGKDGGGGGGYTSKIKVMRRPTCTSVCWSRDGSYLFSGYTDNTIRVWTVLPTPSSTSAVNVLED